MSESLGCPLSLLADAQDEGVNTLEMVPEFKVLGRQIHPNNQIRIPHSRDESLINYILSCCPLLRRRGAYRKQLSICPTTQGGQRAHLSLLSNFDGEVGDQTRKHPLKQRKHKL